MINKLYRIEERYILQKAKLFLSNFIKHKVKFIDMFPILADPFESDFEIAINEAKILEFDDENLAKISMLKYDIDEKMAEAVSGLSNLFVYVKLAYKNRADWESFGWKLFKKARQNYLKMVNLLEIATKRAAEPDQWAKLTAKGYKLASREALEELATDIENLQFDLENKKNYRKRQTVIRIEKYNAIWEKMQELNRASKLVFADSPALQRAFYLY
jgi:hypothetical protein